MPQLVALDKRYRDKGFRLIGVHAQDGTDEEILEPVKKNKAKYSIARTGQSPIQVEGIPHMFIFNGKGEMVFNGHSGDGEAEKIIKKELRGLGDAGGGSADSPFGPKKSTATGLLVPERTWTSADGRTMVAALVSVKEGKATFKRKNGKSFDLDLSKLSDPDRKIIEEAEKKASGAGSDEKE
ncbi:MAG: TlpA disulfide reductase family protein [Verrucomicrobiales bacterium]